MLKKLLLVGLLFGSSLFVSANNNPLDTIASPKQIEKSGTSKGIGIAPKQAGLKYRFQYVDDYDATLPLRYLKVELHDVRAGGDRIMDTVYTDKEGYASFTADAFNISGFSSLIPVYVKIYSESENITVLGKDNNEYVWQSEVVNYSLTEILNYTKLFSTYNDTLSQGFAVSQPAIIYSEYATFLNNGQPISHCKVYYPDETTDNAYYIAGGIHLTNKKLHGAQHGTGTNKLIPNIYQDYDVIGHEYGHHVQSCLKLNKNIGGDHWGNSNIQDDYMDRLDYGLPNSRFRGIYLSYSEGWATAFSLLAQRHFAPYLTDVKWACDSKMTSFNWWRIDYSTYDVCFGEGSEESVTAFIWNLFDEYDPMDPHDNICLAEELLMSFSIGSKTFSDFYLKVIDGDPDMDSILYMLTRLNMNPQRVAVVNDIYTNVAPVFNWSTGGGSKYFPNNDFDIYVEIEEDGMYESFYYNVKTNRPLTSMSFRMPQEDWDRIIELDPEVFKVTVVGWCEWYGVRTGGFESETIEVEVPVETKSLPDPITFVPTDFAFGRKYEEDYLVTEIEKAGHSFETARLRTGCIDKDHIVLSAKNKNAGEAMFEMTTDCGFSSFTYDVSLWSENERIKPTNSTIIVEVMNEHGEWFFESDLWYDVTLPTDRNNMLRITTNSPDSLALVANTPSGFL